MVNVIMKTSEGEVEIELNDEKAPLTVENFLKYADEGFYDGTIFHRVINNFMIQGGGFLPGMKEKETKESVKNEADNGLKNLKGTIAMARTQIPDSASSQFFINVKDNDFLNHSAKTMQGWGYAVFGKVVSGLDVVDKIKVVETGSHGYFEDVPKKNVEIISVKRK